MRSSWWFRVCLSGVVCAAAAAGAVSAQVEPAPVVTLPTLEPAAGFDTVSVKVNVSGNGAQGARTSGRIYAATNMPLRLLIAAAFGIPGPQSYRLLGGPTWIGTSTPPFGGERFDIVATLPDGARPAQVPAMLRSLLADRFRLAVHTELREAQMYALVVARGDRRLGPRLRRAAIDCDALRASGTPLPEAKPGERGPCDAEIGDAILGRGQRLTTLARYVTPWAGRPVVDRTGLTGAFDFELESPELMAGPGGASADVPAGGIFTAIQEQLGLKLESIRGSLEYLVIDRVERPAGN